MARLWLRRAALLAATATACVLTACGGGTIESQLHPTRIVAFGDAPADMGQTTSTASPYARYTINDTTVNTWTGEVALAFALPLTTVRAGGTSYATGNARVLGKPDAAGDATTPTVKEQIDAFLASGSFTATDLVIVHAGTSDVISEVAAVVQGGQTTAQMLTDVGQAGRDLADQVRRLVNAGAKQVVVVGPYNLGRSLLAIRTNQVTSFTDASARFNEQLLVSMVDLGANVLYIDSAFFFNLLTSVPSGYGFANASTPVCTSVDPGPGIGGGLGQVNSKECTTLTLQSGVTAGTSGQYLFADEVYFTPTANRLFGDWAYERIHQRF